MLTGGTVQFVNPSETNRCQHDADHDSIQQYNINLRFEGPTNQLKTQYTSDPALPQADIINLLAFGQTTEAAANNTASTNQTAESLVASASIEPGDEPRLKDCGHLAAFDQPGARRQQRQGPPGANITIQQRVTGNLFVTFSTNVASTQSQTIQGQYQVSPRVAVSATRDPNGGFALRYADQEYLVTSPSCSRSAAIICHSFAHAALAVKCSFDSDTRHSCAQ